MPKQTMTWFGFVLMAVFVAGCASANNPGGGITMRTYTMEKPRVDQKITGNAGYIQGTPPPAALRSPAEKDRQIFVVEVTKEPPIPRTVKTPAPAPMPAVAPAPAPEPQPLVIPPLEEKAAAATGSSQAVKYTVRKGDTLQKISKKFYHSYSRWTKIYEANKDIIKNPNRIKPGIVITIPSAN